MNLEMPPTMEAKLALRPVTIEKVFTDCEVDLQRIVVLDHIEILPDGYTIHCHDLHGQLPELVMKNSGDTFKDKDQMGTLHKFPHPAPMNVSLLKG